VTDRPDTGAELHFVVPAGIDDPSRPSGGNFYDRRVSGELSRQGWLVREHLIPGTWPTPDPRDRDALDRLLAELADDALVLIDGLIASAAVALVQATARLRVAVLLHMPLAEASSSVEVELVERSVLRAVAAVITTSEWARQWVITHVGVDATRVRAALPGADAAPAAARTSAGTNLLCTGPITPAKGHDVLLSALKKIADLSWHCTCAGALDRDTDFVASLQAAAAQAGLDDRVVFPGPLRRSALEDLRARTDLLVAASRRESYGMAVTEALSCGIPVIVTDVGGHREAIGRAPDGSRPGMLLALDDADALAEALRGWLTDAGLRDRWRRSAELRSGDLPRWPETARTVTAALQAIRLNPGSNPARP
jgi:glycosyltransferase involved in cell wall biosynthesis